MYWIQERAISPFVVTHRKGIIRTAGLVYLAVLYLTQGALYRLNPTMSLVGWHWAFLNLMLISLYVIAVRIGDWITVSIQELCCAVYLGIYAQPLTPIVIIIWLVWVLVLSGLIVFRQSMQVHRYWDYLGIVVLGLSGIVGIYVSRPRTFDAWWWVRDVGAFLILGVIVAEYNRLTARTDAQTATLQRVSAYEQMTRETMFVHDQTTLSQMLNEAKSQHQQLTIAALDVDRFGEFNQRYGYLAGNIAMVAITDRLRQLLAEFDFKVRLFRSGGEEFTVALLGADADQANQAINDCLESVRRQPFPVDGKQVAMTLSAGVTAVHDTDQSINEVYKRADDRLRISKQHGRDQLQSDTSPATIAAVPQLTYFAQPIELVTDSGVEQWGAELLLREFNAATNRWQLPAKFDIHVEKQIALMTEIINRSKLRCMTINLTLAQFSDVNTASALAGFATADYGPAGLIVEIIEVPDLSTIRRVTAIYRDAGIRVFIDDVGSDNTYELVCQILPYIDGIKFAMQNLRQHESLKRIRERVTFWVNVAKREANLDFILEGVEDEDDVKFARTLGIDYFQGYYFGKPSLPEA
ncbi:bifunctional diguanylate cyclase/phosphodiesterase [Lacticaseibacillus sp. GG6-2]